jgi:hypothetical protein
VENKFERAYYLKTLSWGALTRRWPAGYSVWLEDERVEEGYRLLRVSKCLLPLPLPLLLLLLLLLLPPPSLTYT